MIRNNLLTILITMAFGIAVAFLGKMEMWYIGILALSFVIFAVCRGKQFWLIVVSYIINTFVFLASFSQTHGNTIMPLGNSFVFSLMGFSAFLILIYGIINIFMLNKRYDYSC